MGQLATAYVQIVPTVKGIGNSLKKQISGAMGSATPTVDKHSTGWGNRISSALGGAFTSVAKVGGAAFAGVTGAVASFIPEAVRASDATDKFKTTLQFAGLGSSEIDKLTASSRKYADQTVYELSDIQNITAQLASNGVPNFDKLAQAAGNLNAVAGGNADTFKSVGMVMTQTAGAGKLTTENWNQLSDAIPGASGKIQQALADAGAYTGNFRDAMANGEITAEEFNNAIMSLGFDEAAQEAATSTATMEGAVGNLAATIEGGLGDIISTLKPTITNAINGLSEAIGPIFEKVNEWIGQLVDGGFSRFGEVMAGLAPVIGLAVGALGGMAAQLPIIGGAFEGIMGPAGLVLGLLTSLFANSEDLRNAFGQMAGQVGGALFSAFQTLQPALTIVLDAFNQIMQILGDALAPIIEQLTPILTQIIDLVANALAQVLPVIAPLLVQIAEIIGEIIGKLTEYLMPVIQAILPVVQTVIETVVTVVTNAITAVQNIINAIMAAINGDWSTAWNLIKQAVSLIWDAICTLISGAFDFIKNLFSLGMEALGAIWSAAWDLIKTTVSTIWDGIKTLVSNAIQAVSDFISNGLDTISSLWNEAWTTVKTFVSDTWENVKNTVSTGVSNVVSFISELPGKAVNALSSFASSLKNTATNAWNAFKDAVSSGISNALNLISGLPGRVVSALGDLGSTLYESGRALLRGFADGISSMFSTVVGKVKDGLSWVRSLFPFSPAKDGPFSGHGWVLYSGLSIGEAMADGIRRSSSKAVSAAYKMQQEAQAALDLWTVPDLYAAGQPAGRAGRSMSLADRGSVTFNIGQITNPQVEPTSTTLSRQLARAAAGVGTLI